ncbi:hypothetical protein DFJ74DRAFT_442263 [Hyaloraphidium curvatum]|nr:hypothetical protein DFJ74DRAFT_442263 [Hyaloraphidium curvatum]
MSSPTRVPTGGAYPYAAQPAQPQYAQYPAGVRPLIPPAGYAEPLPPPLAQVVPATTADGPPKPAPIPMRYWAYLAIGTVSVIIGGVLIGIYNSSSYCTGAYCVGLASPSRGALFDTPTALPPVLLLGLHLERHLPAYRRPHRDGPGLLLHLQVAPGPAPDHRHNLLHPAHRPRGVPAAHRCHRAAASRDQLLRQRGPGGGARGGGRGRREAAAAGPAARVPPCLLAGGPVRALRAVVGVVGGAVRPAAAGELPEAVEGRRPGPARHHGRLNLWTCLILRLDRHERA